MTFDASDLIAVLGDHPGRAISAMLEDKPQVDEEELPETVGAIFRVLCGC